MDWSISNLLWLLASVALFYWMMKRGGCGMHGSHSQGTASHGGHQRGASDAGSQQRTQALRDPVCGMSIDPEHAAGMRAVRGQNYFFCSNQCLARFDQDPGTYARETDPPESTPHGHQHHAGCC